MERSDMKTTLANQLPRINLANGGSMQSAQVVTLKSGQKNASSVDSKSPIHSFKVRTSSTLPRCSRVTSNPEVFDSSVGLVPTNALALTGLANFRVAILDRTDLRGVDLSCIPHVEPEPMRDAP